MHFSHTFFIWVSIPLKLPPPCTDIPVLPCCARISVLNFPSAMQILHLLRAITGYSTSCGEPVSYTHLKATKRIMEYFVKSYDNIVPWEGTVKPKIETISYYEMPSHKENRIYLSLIHI